MINEKLFINACRSLLNAQKYLKENSGFIAVGCNEDYIQVTANELYMMSKYYRCKVNVEFRGDFKYPYEYTISVKGIKFLAVGNHESLRKEVIPPKPSHPRR